MSIQLRIEQTASENIIIGGNVHFNTVSLLEGDVVYDFDTGFITINKTGTFIINWFVTTVATLSTDRIVFSIMSSCGDTIIGNNCRKTGETSGFGIIEVGSAGEAVWLQNKSLAPVLLQPLVPIKASLMLFELKPGITIMGSYNTLQELIIDHPTGNAGDAYVVSGNLYVWDKQTNAWEQVAKLSGPKEIQFGATGLVRVGSGATGGRAVVSVVGLGYDNIASTNDPITLPCPAISIKTISGGVITEIDTVLSVVLGSGDLTTATVYVQLYSASPFNDEVFTPVPNTQAQMDIPMYVSAGQTFTTKLKNLSVKIEPETQLVLGFYSTSNVVTHGMSVYLSGVVKMV